MNLQSSLLCKEPPNDHYIIVKIFFAFKSKKKTSTWKQWHNVDWIDAGQGKNFCEKRDD